MWNCELDAPQLYVSHALPFGSSAAVRNFNRAGRTLERVIAGLLLVSLTSFLTDYLMMRTRPSPSRLT